MQEKKDWLKWLSIRCNEEGKLPLIYLGWRLFLDSVMCYLNNLSEIQKEHKLPTPTDFWLFFFFRKRENDFLRQTK